MQQQQQHQYLYSSHPDSYGNSYICSNLCESPPRPPPPTYLLQVDAASPWEISRSQPRVIFLCEDLEAVSRLVRDRNSRTTVLPHQQPVELIEMGNRHCGQSLMRGEEWFTSSALSHVTGKESAGESAPMRTVSNVRLVARTPKAIAPVGEQMGECAGNRDGTLGDATSPIDILGDSDKPQLTDRAGWWNENVKFMGVSKHKKSGRYEAHIWIPAYGKQIYLGGFRSPGTAAIAYDIVAMKTRKPSHPINFPHELYAASMNWIESTKLSEIIAHIKRQSKGFTRGLSKFRGVSRTPSGYWEARSSAGTGRHLFLGLYKDEETAACHYDRALVRLKGDSALTNFPIDEYQDEIKQHAEAEQALAEDLDLQDKQYRAWVKGGRGGEAWEHRA